MDKPHMSDGEKRKHPGSANLIPLNTRPMEERQAIGRIGGLASGASKSLSRKIEALIKKGMEDESALHLHEIMTDHSLSSLDIRLYLEKVKKKLTKADDKMKMAKLLLDWHKTRHGEKQNKQQIEHFGASTIKVEFDEPGERAVDVTPKDGEEE